MSENKQEAKPEATPAEAKPQQAPPAAAPKPAPPAPKPVVLTDKRNQERIFRREMGEPEFFRYKKDLAPKVPVLSEDEQKEISRQAEIPKEVTPMYNPQHILSPEYEGTSNYESGISKLVLEAQQKLKTLKGDPEASPEEISKVEDDLKYLDSLYQNFYFGMNVFRTAKGGRKPKT